MKSVRDFLFEGENVFDMPIGWWEKWKKLHDGEFDIDKDDFKDTVDVKQGAEKVFTYDKARNKVFTDKPFEFFVDESRSVSLNESINPFYGWYDASNGNVEQFVKKLQEHGIEHTYDPNHNFCEVRSEDWDAVRRIMKESNIRDGGGFGKILHDDAVMWTPTAKGREAMSRIPPGAMM